MPKTFCEPCALGDDTAVACQAAWCECPATQCVGDREWMRYLTDVPLEEVTGEPGLD